MANVKDFGAMGDGVTDDTAAIQNAIYSSGSESVYFPSGTYIVSDVIQLTAGTRLVGAGGMAASVIKLKNNCSPKPYAILNADGTTKYVIDIANLTIDGNRDNNIDHGTSDENGNQSPYWGGVLVALINLNNCIDVKVKDCTVMNSWGSGINIADCNIVEVSGNTVFSCRMSGIVVKNRTSTSDVGSTNSRITNNYVSGCTDGIHVLFGSRFLTIANNICSSCSDAQRFPASGYSGTYPNVWPSSGGFKAYGQSGYVMPAQLGDGAGIELTGKYTDASAVNNDTIAINGNICTWNQAGVRVEEMSCRGSIIGNVCSENTIHGIFIFSSAFWTISGNTCYLNGTDGIRIEKLNNKDISEQIVVTGNTLTRNQEWGLGVIGGRQIAITGNNISGNSKKTSVTKGGIGFYSVNGIVPAYCAITGNIFINYDGTDYYGVYDGTGGSVIKCSVVGNTFQNMRTAVTNLNTSNNMIASNAI